jgi:hypothetical protein
MKTLFARNSGCCVDQTVVKEREEKEERNIEREGLYLALAVIFSQGRD